MVFVLFCSAGERGMEDRNPRSVLCYAWETCFLLMPDNGNAPISSHFTVHLQFLMNFYEAFSWGPMRSWQTLILKQECTLSLWKWSAESLSVLGWRLQRGRGHMTDQGLFAQIDVSLRCHAGDTYRMPYRKLLVDLESDLSPADSCFTVLPGTMANLPFQYGITAVQMQTYSFSPTFCISLHPAAK